jgi:hypothetical protein
MENGKQARWRPLAAAIFHFLFSVFCFLSVFIGVHLWFPFSEPAQEMKEEVVANLAAGRVTIFVAKDGILVATQGNPIEPGTRMPVVVPLSSRRVAVLLGAVEWVFPALNKPAFSLARELPGALAKIAGPKRLEAEQEGDIEHLGASLLEPLRVAAGSLHNQIEFPEDEPVVQMLIIGYVENYGAEVWELKYRIRQDFLRENYWRTRVLRPSYTQLYPPEKGQPRTLVDSRYPPEDTEAGLPGLWQQGDSRLERIKLMSVPAAKAAERLAKGESHKAELEGATEWFRTALNAVVPQTTPLGLLVIREQRGFEWVVAPPERPETAAVEQKPREPGAPTLRKP